MNTRSDLHWKFEEAVTESFLAYIRKGARSPDKVRPLHNFIAGIIEEELDDSYQVISMRAIKRKGEEEKVKGRYYDKNVDIAIKRKGKVIAVVGVKFVTSNYKQNTNNYFENMLGEIANIKVQGIIYANLLILRKDMPYRVNDSDGKQEKHKETIKDHHLDKYYRLHRDVVDNSWYMPDVMGMIFMDIEDSSRRAPASPAQNSGEIGVAKNQTEAKIIAKTSDVHDLPLSAENKEFLQEVSIENFFSELLDKIKQQD